MLEKQLIQNIKSLGLPLLNDDITKILIKGGEKISKELFDKYNIEDERGRPVITIITKDDYGDTEAFMIREKEDILSLSHMIEGKNGMKIVDFIDFGNDYDGHKELYNHLESITNEHIIESNDDFSLDF